MDDDIIEETGGFTFYVNQNLADQVGGVTIDLSYMGFSVEPDRPLAAESSSGCTSCASGSSCSV